MLTLFLEGPLWVQILIGAALMSLLLFSINTENLTSLMSYKDCFDKVISVQYQGLGSSATDSLGNMSSYEFMPNDVDLAVQNILKKSVGQTTISTLDNNIITYENYFGTTPTSYKLPAATVTERGKTPTKYGVDSSSQLISLDSGNLDTYL